MITLSCYGKGGRMHLFEIRSVEYLNIIKYPDISIQKGKTTFICGKSGTGKSTLLKLLNGSKSAEKGEVKYMDKLIDDYDPIEHRKQVILVNQSTYLFDMSIRDNFYEFYSYRDMAKPDEDTIKQYLKLCLADFNLDMDCQNMSGGERQRIYLAICLSFMPKVIMLDEPTSALDEANAGILIRNVKNFCIEKDISLIIVSHSTELAKLYSDDCINLSGGEEQWME